MLDRSYRKTLKQRGFIYFGGEEQAIYVKNLSITGVLAELVNSANITDIREIFETLKQSTTLDMYLPDMGLSGECEVIRVDMLKDAILLALEFRHISYDADDLFYSRRSYRKKMEGRGKILLNDTYHDFDVANVSLDGLMIQLNEAVDVADGTVTVFELDPLDLNGDIKVIWNEPLDNGKILVGLQFLNMENTVIRGIPRFAKE